MRQNYCFSSSLALYSQNALKSNRFRRIELCLLSFCFAFDGVGHNGVQLQLFLFCFRSRSVSIFRGATHQTLFLLWFWPVPQKGYNYLANSWGYNYCATRVYVNVCEYNNIQIVSIRYHIPFTGYCLCHVPFRSERPQINRPHLSRHLLVNLEKSSFSQKLVFW